MDLNTELFNYMSEEEIKEFFRDKLEEMIVKKIDTYFRNFDGEGKLFDLVCEHYVNYLFKKYNLDKEKFEQQVEGQIGKAIDEISLYHIYKRPVKQNAIYPGSRTEEASTLYNLVEEVIKSKRNVIEEQVNECLSDLNNDHEQLVDIIQQVVYDIVNDKLTA